MASKDISGTSERISDYPCPLMPIYLRDALNNARNGALYDDLSIFQTFEWIGDSPWRASSLGAAG